MLEVMYNLLGGQGVVDDKNEILALLITILVRLADQRILIRLDWYCSSSVMLEWHLYLMVGCARTTGTGGLLQAHKSLAGFALGTTLLRGGTSPTRFIAIASAFAVASPCGASAVHTDVPILSSRTATGTIGQIDVAHPYSQ